MPEAGVKRAVSDGFGKINLAGGLAALMIVRKGLPADIFMEENFLYAENLR